MYDELNYLKYMRIQLYSLRKVSAQIYNSMTCRVTHGHLMSILVEDLLEQSTTFNDSKTTIHK